MKTNDKKSFFIFICVLFAGLLAFGVTTYITDPYFHYHKPYFKYMLNNERYQNDGIVKNFDYNAMIVGSSMTECFLTSTADELWQTNTIKVPIAGSTWKEVNDLVETALAANPECKLVIRGLEGIRYFDTYDYLDYDPSTFPTYLYDQNPLNDVKYLFNKEIFVTDVWDVIGRTRTHKPSMSFDEYSNFNNYYPFGNEAVKTYYARETVTPEEKQHKIKKSEYTTIAENVQKNIIDTADRYPDVEFCYFFTPYSIYYWDYMLLLGEMERQIGAEEYIASLVTSHPNIHLYSFYNQHDAIENLDLYKDTHHYGETMSNMILNWIHDDVGRLTADNYKEFYSDMRKYYFSYDYDSKWNE